MEIKDGNMVTLEMRETNGDWCNLYTKDNHFIGVVYDYYEGYVPQNAPVSVESLCQLREANFTADDIIKLKNGGLL